MNGHIEGNGKSHQNGRRTWGWFSFRNQANGTHVNSDDATAALLHTTKTVTFDCPACRQEISAPEAESGHTISCPQCLSKIVVPPLLYRSRRVRQPEIRSPLPKPVLPGSWLDLTNAQSDVQITRSTAPEAPRSQEPTEPFPTVGPEPEIDLPEPNFPAPARQMLALDLNATEEEPEADEEETAELHEIRDSAKRLHDELAALMQRCTEDDVAIQSQLKAELAAAQHQVVDLQSESRQAANKVVAQEQEIRALRQSLAERARELSSMCNTAERMTNELEQLQERYAELVAGRNGWEQRYKEAAAELEKSAAAAQSELAARDEKITELTMDLAHASQDRDAMRTEARNRGQLDSREAELRTQLDIAIDRETKHRAIELEQKSELARLQESLHRHTMELDAMRAVGMPTTNEMSDLRKRYNDAVAARDEWERRCQAAIAESRITSASLQLDLKTRNEHLTKAVAALGFVEKQRDVLRARYQELMDDRRREVEELQAEVQKFRAKLHAGAESVG